VNPLRDRLDNALDVRGLSRVDRIRLARLDATRALVWSRLHELGHQLADHDQQVTIPQVGALSSTAFDNLRNATAERLVAPSDTYTLPVQDLSAYICEVLPGVAGPDPLILEERKALRRFLRLLNKVIAIALRREAFLDSLRHLVLRLRAFFVTHGNHPPRIDLSAICMMPERRAV
jgi:hypothetical protein